MTFSEMYRIERKLLHEIEKEKKFSWHKIAKIIELEAFTIKNRNY